MVALDLHFVKRNASIFVFQTCKQFNLQNMQAILYFRWSSTYANFCLYLIMVYDLYHLDAESKHWANEPRITTNTSVLWWSYTEPILATISDGGTCINLDPSKYVCRASCWAVIHCGFGLATVITSTLLSYVLFPLMFSLNSTCANVYICNIHQ